MASKLLRCPERIPTSVLSWSARCEFEQNRMIISLKKKSNKNLDRSHESFTLSSDLGHRLVRSFAEASVYSGKEGGGP